MAKRSKPPLSPARAASPYSVHPGVAMVQKWIVEMPEKTGRSLEQWLVAIKKQKFEDSAAGVKAARAWLKGEHDIGTNTAWWLVERAFGMDEGLADSDPAHYLAMAPKYVDAMYTGPKAGLRPLCDRLLSTALGLGPDAKASPCKTMVPIYRAHVIAQLKPTTRTRLDLGLALAKHPKAAKGTLPKRLIDTGGMAKKDRITHRIGIEHERDIDEQVSEWLREAYELDEAGEMR